MTTGLPLDLVVLVPGVDERETLDGLFRSRSQSLGIRKVSYQFIVSTQRDSGCFKDADALLRPYHDRAAHALVMFDHFGSGQENRSAGELERILDERMTRSGWQGRAAAVVLRPELENWVWSGSPHVDDVLGWRGRSPSLRDWLRDINRWPQSLQKPPAPKACLTAALREAQIPHSPRLFRALAERVSITGCKDPAFEKFVRLMRGWFPAQNSSALSE